MSTITLFSILTCPDCSFQSNETMPENACVWFYICKGCGERLKLNRAIAAYSAPTVMFPARTSKVIAAKFTEGGRNMEGKITMRTLVTLSDEAPLKAAFNKEIGKTRLIVLVSPT